ncbi:MAG: helix-turn-helix transcriptional regulator [Dehalococcoidia bacterium]|nr:helix-turn-helix transcriptional regulator [Dehalococcoidia bacterium]
MANVAKARTLQGLRIERGYTLETASGFLGCSPQHLNDMELGRVGCSLSLLTRLKQLYGVSYEVLIPMVRGKSRPRGEKVKADPADPDAG